MMPAYIQSNIHQLSRQRPTAAFPAADINTTTLLHNQVTSASSDAASGGIMMGAWTVTHPGLKYQGKAERA